MLNYIGQIIITAWKIRKE